MNIPSKASWCVRQILNLRHVGLRFIKYQVGVDSQFSLWLDPWVNGESLLSRLALQ